MKRFLVVVYLVLFSGFLKASTDETCVKAASKIVAIIDDWNSFVIEHSKQDKNPSVMSMHSDYKAGTLKNNFMKKCTDKWDKNQDVFECFSGIRSEMGAAMCLHPDTNKNNWEY